MKVCMIVLIGSTLIGCKDPRDDSRELMRSADALEKRIADEHKKNDEHLREINEKDAVVHEIEARMRNESDPAKREQLEAELVKAMKARSDTAMATGGTSTTGSGGAHKTPCACNPVDPLCDC